MVGGAILVAIAQGAAMLHANGVSLSTPYDFTTMTMGGAITVIVGAGLIATKRFVVASGDGGRPARDEAD